ncbi:LysR family transcriptional regulator [Zhongshania sp. BJYM1]|uniref:LysR family transcriptional regulator n=1 Tax=Zhongshania aquatica TaxID=2965069 RepID=UPI0022B3689E|nr:LysR family transcriptional regulator [Marortus sp. BJYM1]
MGLKTTFEQWRMFKAVVDHGGFHQASQVVHKSQTTIHHAVHKLEESLGVTLLEVQGRKAVLTPAGQLMLRRANYLIDEAEKMEAVAKSLSMGVESRLDIAVDEAFPQAELYQVLETVSAEFPFLRIELRETVLSGANELVEQGKVVVAISPMRLANGLNEEICQMCFIAVASPNHPLLNRGRQLAVEDLKAYRQIVVRDSALGSQHDAGWLGADQRWTVSHMRSSIDLVCRGLGFAWLPESEISDKIAAGSLVRLPIPSAFDRHVSFYLNYKDPDQLGPAARSFMGELRFQTQHLQLSADK